MHKPTTAGFGLVEVLIGCSIIVVGILGLISSYSIYIKYAYANMYNVQAAYLAEEGIEAMTFIRDNGWTKYITPLSTSTLYYLSFANNIWNATTTLQYEDAMFLRTIELDEVMRNISGEQVATGGTVDEDTKLITVRVQYLYGGATTTHSLATYLTNINND
jgi:hypothetical protein